MLLQIVSISRLAQDPLTQSAHDYLKRLQQLGPAQLQRYKRAEESRKLLHQGHQVVLLCPRGQLISSLAIATSLANWQRLGRKQIVFALGAAEGHLHSPSPLEQRWSFGPITLPHRLALVVLLEQLYRARTILAGHSYHKGDEPQKQRLRHGA